MFVNSRQVIFSPHSLSLSFSFFFQDAKRSFCSAFYEYAAAIGGLTEENCNNAEMSSVVEGGGGIPATGVIFSEDGQQAKNALDQANPVATAAIAAATPAPTRDFKPVDLCARVIVTRADLFLYLPDLAADLELYKQFADVDPLYPGFFLPVANSNGPAAALHVPGCMLERENTARGIPATANGVPWGHYHIDLRRRDGLRIQPVETGSLMHQVFDASARQSDPTDNTVSPNFRPVLLKWHRPNAAFQRHNYFVSTIIPGTYDKNQITMLGGDTYRLTRVEMAPWTERCEAWRNMHFLGLCPAGDPLTTYDMESSVKSFNPLNDGKNPTTPWKTVCYGDATADAATCGLEFNEATHCDYKRERPRKLLAPRLEEYSPEAAHFLRSFEITTEDIEEMMGSWSYDDDYTTFLDRNKRRRHAVCDWVRRNRDRWDKYLNTGTNATRCLGEMNYRIDGNGKKILFVNVCKLFFSLLCDFFAFDVGIRSNSNSVFLISTLFLFLFLSQGDILMELLAPGMACARRTRCETLPEQNTWIPQQQLQQPMLQLVVLLLPKGRKRK